MSVSGYFNKGSVPSTRRVNCGVNSNGDVLSGNKTVRERLQAEAHQATNPALPCYAHPADYDPVLRSHLRAAPPKIEQSCPYTGMVMVAGEWMKRSEYEARYPDFSKK